jgi:WD40 repeat protein/beta-lactamase regulating signal transducer with metallopeptidase domain
MSATVLWLTVGWTMLHFVWVGAMIAIFVAIVRSMIRDASDETRYAAALASLALLALAPAAIAWRVSRAIQAEHSFPEPDNAKRVAPERRERSELRGLGDQDDRPAGAGRTDATIVGVDRAGVPRRLKPSLGLDDLALRLPWLWLVGSPLTFGWLALGLVGAERLRRSSRLLADGELARLCRRLAGQLGIVHDVAVAVCDQLATPILVGVVRPLILVPAAALSSWRPEQIEMVLLHELAHVRRWDNLINLLQRLVESALFFHPAVWLISAWVRREREHCCDRIVVAHTGRPRVYINTLMALAGERPPAVSTAMAQRRKQLTDRIYHILTPRLDHPMKLSGSLIVAAAAAIVAPAFWIAALAEPQSSPQSQTTKSAVPSSAQDAPAKEKKEKAATPSITIEGKLLANWIAALEDPDPAVRKRAVEVLSGVTKDQAGDQLGDIRAKILGVMSSDKAPEVRRAAAKVADDFKLADAPEIKRQRLEMRKQDVGPTPTLIRLVDENGRPVSGATVSSYFSRDCDREPAFTSPEPIEAQTSDDRGEVTLELDIPGHIDGTAIFAIRQVKGRPLVGLRKVLREEIGKPITTVMYPACRVLFRIESTGLRALEKKYNAELSEPGWWRAAYITVGGTIQAPRPLFASSTTGELEFLLPPGQFTIWAYGGDVKRVERSIEIKPGDRELLLGTFDLLPSKDADLGRFPDHHRVRANANAGGPAIAFRRIRFLPLGGLTIGAHDVAFSPDGKILATAHSYNADPGEVKLWDTSSGTLKARLPAPGKGVLTLQFSANGKLLAGRAHPLADPKSAWEIVLWDVASRREAQALRGHTGRIQSLAFSPDGHTLASSGADQTTRFWDVASGRETGRIEKNDVWGRVAAYSPDGQTLAMIGTGHSIKLWNVAGRRLIATLEPQAERFAVQSVAFAPEGRTLAAAGSTYDAKGFNQEGQVRLYDVGQEPFRRRAILSFNSENPGGLNHGTSMCSDVAFTPDGRRLIAVAMQNVRAWDVATGIEQSAFERSTSTSSDRLAVSPDGHWLAITGHGEVSVVDIPPSP